MPKYLIQRDVAGIGAMTPVQLHGMSAKSNSVLAGMDGRAQWVQSFVTGDHLFCVYNAENEEAVREHARLGGFPCDEIRKVVAMVDPVTGES